MSGEKKHWRLSIPFRRFSGPQDLQSKAPKRSECRVSSVYLSDDSSIHGFTIVPEFDYPVQTHPKFENSDDGSSHSGCNLPSNPSYTVNNGPSNLQPIIDFQYSCLGVGSTTSTVDTSQDDDLTKRLGFAYEHIRSMLSAISSNVSFSSSSNPQALRDYLGIPQHSVFNHSIGSFPDLPNPYVYPQEPKYTEAFTTTPDVLYASTTESGLSVRMDTNTFPPSTRRSPDPSQPTQTKPVMIAPTATQGSPSQRGPLGTPWSTHTPCASKLQLSKRNPSRLAKRRVEKTTLSHSTFPPFDRKACRGVSRNSGADTQPPAESHRRHASLRQIRSPSPLRVDMPLYHAWHDRCTDFDSSFAHDHFKRFQCCESKSQHTSGNTEVLASLAWIGTPCTADRKCPSASPKAFVDCFSMGIAVEDDSISDDVLVDRLEKVRRIGGISERTEDASPSRCSRNLRLFSSGRDDDALPLLSCSSSTSSSLSSPSVSSNTTSDSEDAAIWQAARKAFLCIREIVRTEKKYQEALKMLLNAQTATPPPPSMVPYVSALVRVSEMLMERFLEDPSAWGISTAFVTSEDELEAAMVSWCAVAGSFFTDGNNPRSSSSLGKWRLRKFGAVPSSSPPFVPTRPSAPLSPHLLSTPNGVNMTGERMVKEYHEGQHPQIEAEKNACSASLQKPESAKNETLTGQPPGRKLSVRDLAIQPIQRVMRYVLLYRDLLDCTPATSPPRLLVERAVDTATRIAHQCDRAQRNPAFCLAP